MAEQTLDNLVAAIARRYGFYARGIITAGGVDFLADTDHLIQPDNTWVNHYVHILTGINAGLERLVSTYVDSMLGFNAMPQQMAAGDGYEVGPLQHEDIVQAIQSGISRAGTAWMCVVDDTSGAFVSGQQEYNLPADVMTVLGVYIWSATAPELAGSWSPLASFEVVGMPGARKLLMRGWGTTFNVPADSVTYQRRVRYLALPALLANGSDTLGMGELAERQALSFLEDYALYVLNDMAFNRNRTGEAARAHLTASQSAYARAMQTMAERALNRETRYMRGPHVGRQI